MDNRFIYVGVRMSLVYGMIQMMGNVMDNGFVNWYMDYEFEIYFIGV